MSDHRYHLDEKALRLNCACGWTIEMVGGVEDASRYQWHLLVVLLDEAGIQHSVLDGSVNTAPPIGGE